MGLLLCEDVSVKELLRVTANNLYLYLINLNVRTHATIKSLITWIQQRPLNAKPECCASLTRDPFQHKLVWQHNVRTCKTPIKGFVSSWREVAVTVTEEGSCSQWRLEVEESRRPLPRCQTSHVRSHRLTQQLADKDKRPLWSCTITAPRWHQGCSSDRWVLSSKFEFHLWKWPETSGLKDAAVFASKAPPMRLIPDRRGREMD